MKFTKIGYTKGINQDNALDKREAGSYFNAENFSISNLSEGSSLNLGNLENVTGNLGIFKLPLECFVLGGYRFKNYLFLVTTTKQVRTNEGLDQLWLIKINPDTNQAVNPDNSLVPIGGFVDNSTLIFNKNINLSTETVIKDIEVRYENELVATAIWCDGFNPLASVNLFQDLTDVDSSQIYISVNFQISIAEITNVFDFGGFLKPTNSIQIAYRLIGFNGSKTVFSPPSNKVIIPRNISSVEKYLQGFADFDETNVPQQGSLQFVINDIDTRFQIIEYYALVFDASFNDSIALPRIFKFAEETISSESVTRLYTGNEQGTIEISLEEFNYIDNSTFIPQTFTIKENRVVAANIKRETFKLNYDARAYNFDINGNCQLIDVNGNVENEFLIGDDIEDFYNQIDEKADCINPDTSVYQYQKNVNPVLSSNNFKAENNQENTVLGPDTDLGFNVINTPRTDRFDFQNVISDPSNNFIPSYDLFNVGTEFVNAYIPPVGTTEFQFEVSTAFEVKLTFTTRPTTDVNLKFNVGLIDELDASVLNPTYVNFVNFTIPNSAIPLSAPFEVTFTKNDLASPVLFIYNAPFAPNIKTGIALYVEFISIEIDPSLNGVLNYFTYFENNYFACILSPFIDSTIQRGGSGKNVSYKILNVYQKNAKVIAGASSADYSLNTDANAKYTVNYDNNYQVALNENFNNNQSRSEIFKVTNEHPISYSICRTFVPGETYRFGLVARDKVGNPSFVEWIADIRIPYLTETNLNLNNKDENNYDFVLNHFINFQIKNLPENIQAIEIVQVERSVDNKSILGYSLLSRIGELNNNLLTSVVSQSNEPPNYIDSIKNGSTLPDFSNPVFKRIKRIESSYLSPNINNYNYLENINYQIKSEFILQIDNTFSIYKNNNGQIITFKKLSNTSGNTTNVLNTKPVIGSSTTINNNIVENILKPFLFGGKEGFTPVNQEYLIRIDNDFLEQNFVLVSIVRNLSTQYGGKGFEVRSNNTYVSKGCFFKLYKENARTLLASETEGLTNFKGDSLSTMNGRIVCFPKNFSNTTNSLFVGVYHQTFEDFPTFTRRTNQLKVNWLEVDLRPQANNQPILARINPSYSEPYYSAKIYFPQQFRSRLTTQNPHEIVVSNKKIDGELNNSWSVFLPLNTKNVEGSYGEITKVIKFKEQVMVLQEYGICVQPIEERITTVDEGGNVLVLGTGDLLGKEGYITTNVGTKHALSVRATEGGLYFYSANMNGIFVFTGEGLKPLSLVTGLNSFFMNNIQGSIKSSIEPYSNMYIIAGYEPETKRVIFTFNKANTSFSLVLNELYGVFEQFIKQPARLYIQGFENLYSIGKGKDLIYQENKGIKNVIYNSSVESSITLLIADEPDFNKIYNFLEWFSYSLNNGVKDSNETFKSIEIFNDFESSGVIPFNERDFKRRLNKWRFNRFRAAKVGNQIRRKITSPFVYITLKYNTSSNTRFIVSDMLLNYSPALF